MEQKETKEFYAFISYKREDERWARWLQHRLEHYRLPANLNGRTDLPKEIRPIFRDTSELLPGNLPQQINDALAASHHLIVICSPHSAQSVWVNKEIETFIALGKQANIIPFIVDGHPFAQNPDEECFPVAIRNLPTEQELLGANVAEMGREAAAVKTVARMFGIRFDTLWGRYQREQKRRRNWIIAAVAVFVLAVLGVAAYIWKQNDDFRHAISRAAAEKALQLIEQGDGYTAQRVALAALDKAYTPEAEAALRQASQCRSAVLRGNTVEVSQLVIPNDNRVISTSSDSTIRVWDMHTGQCLEIMDKHDEWGGTITFSPDGKYTLSQYASDTIIRLKDVSTGKILWSHRGHHAIFSPDGKTVLSTAKDSTIHFWDIKTGKCLKKAKLPLNNSTYLRAISPNGEYIAGSDWDTGFVYSTVTGRLLFTFNESPEYGGEAPFWAFVFSPDSKQLVVASSVSNFFKFDLSTGSCIMKLEGLGRAIAYSPDGKYIATGSNGPVKLIDASSGEVIRLFKGHNNDIYSISFSPDGQRIVSASSDKTIRIWDLDSSIYTSQKKLNIQWNYILHSPDYKYIITSFFDTLHIWDIATGKRLPYIVTGFIGHPSFSSDNKYIVASCADSVLRTWDVATGKCIRTFVGHTDLSFSVTYSPDNKYIASGSWDSTIRIWDATTGKCLKTLRGHTSDHVAFSPDGHCIVSTSYERNVHIWDVATEKCILSLDNLESTARQAIFSPDGKKIIISMDNYNMLICDAVSGKHIQILKGHTDLIDIIAFSPDGNHVVSTDDDNICIWDVNTGKCVQQAKNENHLDNLDVYGPTFSPDGRKVIFLKIIWDKKYTYFLCTWDFLPLDELKAQVRSRFKDNPLTPEERRQYYLE